MVLQEVQKTGIVSSYPTPSPSPWQANLFPKLFICPPRPNNYQNSFCYSIDWSGHCRQNICWNFSQVWISFHGWGKWSNLWCSDYWNMHLSIKYLLCPPGKPPPPVPPLSSYHQPQDRGELLISTVFYFLFIYFPTLPCWK